MGEILQEFVKGLKEGPRMYFAPLTGAFRAVYHEIVDEDDKQLLSESKATRQEKH